MIEPSDALRRFPLRRPAALVALAVALAVAVSTTGPAAASTHDLRRKRSEVQQQRAQVAAQVDALKATNAELDRALATLQGNVRTQEAQLAAARRAVAEATAARNAARAAEERTTAELAALVAAMKRLALDAYVRGSWDIPEPANAASTPGDLARRAFLLDTVVRRDTDVAERLDAAKKDLARQRARAEEAERVAAARRRDVEVKVTTVKRAVADTERVENEVELRMERSLAEADSLRAIDAQLAAEITRRQQALARRIASRPGAGGSGGSRRVGNVALARVRGFTVAASIAEQLEGLLAAAESDGIVFGGGGYRSSEGQVATRRANCGTSNYDIYEKPASQCSPPTARPGLSMHEQGLAIDFTQDGRILSRSSSGYAWLKANAGRFGFRNLPSEPWHWSTNGN